jgi:amidophosphoribosyltransferase
MPNPDELIAHGRSDEEVCKEIGADWLLYQDLEDLIEAVGKRNTDIKQFDTSVFTGNYITGDIGIDYLDNLQNARSDAAKENRRSGDNEVMDLHNTA